MDTSENRESRHRTPMDLYLVMVFFGGGIGTAILLIVIAWGLLAFYVVFGLPNLIKTWQAHLWARAPCVVVSTTPVRYTVRVGTTGATLDFFGAALTYSYEFRGGTYTANRYSPSSSFDEMNGMTEGAVRLTYPVGRELTCYVNPWNPSEAVIDRSFKVPQVWAIVLIPPLLLIFGILGPIYIIRRAKAAQMAAPGS